jgi:hypothetical protein
MNNLACKAVKCPVCEGSGKYEKKQCHGCDGKGWITIVDNYCFTPSRTAIPFIDDGTSDERKQPWMIYYTDSSGMIFHN